MRSNKWMLSPRKVCAATRMRPSIEATPPATQAAGYGNQPAQPTRFRRPARPGRQEGPRSLEKTTSHPPAHRSRPSRRRQHRPDGSPRTSQRSLSLGALPFFFFFWRAATTVVGRHGRVQTRRRTGLGEAVVCCTDPLATQKTAAWWRRPPGARGCGRLDRTSQPLPPQRYAPTQGFLDNTITSVDLARRCPRRPRRGREVVSQGQRL